MIFKEIDNMKDVGAICHYFPSRWMVVCSIPKSSFNLRFISSSTGDLLYDFLSFFLASACDYRHSTFSSQYPGYSLAYSVGLSRDYGHFTLYSSHCKQLLLILFPLSIYNGYDQFRMNPGLNFPSPANEARAFPGLWRQWHRRPLEPLSRVRQKPGPVRPDFPLQGP